MRLSAKAHPLQYHGADEMKPRITDLLPLENLEAEDQRRIAWHHERIIAEGFLEKETISRATEEARAWYKNPRAFNY